MKVRHVLLFMVGGLLALIIGRQLSPGVDEKGDMVANERACKETAPRGFAAYPITRMGELRGCLFVDETDPARFKVSRRTRM